MTQQQAVKGTFEYNDQEYKSYWNGKQYASGFYVTVTRPNGKECKVQYDPRKEGNKKYEYPSLSTFSLEQAKLALHSVGIIE